jgi:rhamnose utilization protein RhaD (predicted bifunctional aldolase and dehydrogenase)
MRPSPVNPEQSRPSSADCLSKLRHHIHARIAAHPHSVNERLHALVTARFVVHPAAAAAMPISMREVKDKSRIGCIEATIEAPLKPTIFSAQRDDRLIN